MTFRSKKNFQSVWVTEYATDGLWHFIATRKKKKKNGWFQKCVRGVRDVTTQKLVIIVTSIIKHTHTHTVISSVGTINFRRDSLLSLLSVCVYSHYVPWLDFSTQWKFPPNSWFCNQFSRTPSIQIVILECIWLFSNAINRERGQTTKLSN